MLELVKPCPIVCRFLIFLLTYTIASSAFAQFAPTHSSNVVNYTPGGQVTISINLTGANPLDESMNVNVEVPLSWVPNPGGVDFINPTPGFGSFDQGSDNRMEFGWSGSFGPPVPSPETVITLTLDVPQDFNETVSVNVEIFRSVTATSGDFTPSSSNPVTINPPPACAVSNPNPADDFRSEQDSLNIGNSVTAGQTITFSADVAAADGQALGGSSFFVATAVFSEESGLWEKDDEDVVNWPTNHGGGDNPQEIDFGSTNSPSTITVNENNHIFTWTSVGGDANGTRTFTWEVPTGLVNKSTAQAERVFIAGIKGLQANGAQCSQMWAVRIDPLNQAPTFVEGSATVNGNATPTPPEVTVNENEPNTFLISVNDPDGIDVLNVAWRIDGADPIETDTIPAETAKPANVDFSSTFDFATVQHPDQTKPISVTAEVNDGSGSPVLFEWMVTVNDVNRLPIIDGVTVDVTPDEPTAADDLLCTVTGDGADADPEDAALQFRYVWSENGNVLRDETTAAKTDLLPAASTSKEQNITCTVTAIDQLGGESGGVADSVTVGNSPPTGADDTLIVSTGVETSFNLAGTDPDGDDITFNALTDAVRLQAGSAADGLHTLFVVATPEQETSLATPSTGSASGRCILDTNANTLQCEVNYQNLTGNVTQAHIHGFAGPGEDGSVLFDFEFTGGPDGVITGVWNYTDTIDPQTTPEGELEQLLLNEGATYVNIHTEANAPGEVRGQILSGFESSLNGSQVVPSTDSAATGSATLTIELTGSEVQGTGITIQGLRYVLQLNGLDLTDDPQNATDPNDVTAIHIHTGGIGNNGPHALNIFGLAGGALRQDDADMVANLERETITGFWDDGDETFTGDGGTKEPFDSLGFSAALSDLNSGNLYFQLHTPANPDGDIRGQIVLANRGGESLTVNPDGSGSFVPGSAVDGDVYAFSYEVNDGSTDSEPHIITMNISDNQQPVVENPSPPPDATPAIPEGGSQAFSVTATDPDPGQTLTIAWKVNGQVVEGQTAESFTYTPDFTTVLHPAKQQTVEIMVEVADEFGLMAMQTWNLPVDDVNQPPNQPTVAVTPGTEAEPKGGDTLTCTVTPAGDPDDIEEGRAEPLAYTYTWTEAGARIEPIVVGPIGELTSTNNQTVKGDSWSCVVVVNDDPYDDGTGSLTTASVASNSVVIVNSAPICNDEIAVTGSEDSVLSGQAQATDPDGDPLTFTKTSDPASGVVGEFTEGGSFTYQPNAEFSGSDSFNYTVSDGIAGAVDCIVNITINPVNDPPTANDISTDVRENIEGDPMAQSVELLLSGDDIEDGPDSLNFMLVRQFKIRIENVSTDTTLAPPGVEPTSVPLAPGVWVVHNQDNPFFTDGLPAFENGLEALAEDGDPSQLGQSVVGQAGIVSSNIFNTPVGASEPSAIGPGDAYEFTIAAAPGDRLNLATMFVQSNDLFFAPAGAGIPLFDGTTPVNGDVTNQIALWDSGTEVNEEPGAGPNQAPRQGAPNTGGDENGLVQLVANVGDGFTYPANNEVIRVTITPAEEFSKGEVQTQAGTPIGLGDMITLADLPLRYSPNVGSQGLEEISYVAVDSSGAESAPANIEITIGFLIGPAPNEPIPTAGPINEMCLRWAAVPGATNYILHLFSRSGQIGTLLNQENVGDITEICITVDRNGNVARFSSNDVANLPSQRSILDGENIKFNWWVVAEGAANGDVVRISEEQSFTIVENNNVPVIDQVSLGGTSDELVMELAEAIGTPYTLDIFRFNFTTSAWDVFESAGVVNETTITVTVEGAGFAAQQFVKVRGKVVETGIVGDFTNSVLE